MKKALILFPALLVSLIFSSPASAGTGEMEQVDPDITSGKAAREFKQAREKWLGWGVSNYRMRVHRSCYCVTPFEVDVTVRNGKPVKVSDRPWYGPFTVPGMFRIIGQAIKRKVAILDVSYDGRLGFPKRAWIDYIAMAADDETGYRITRFKTLKP